MNIPDRVWKVVNVLGVVLAIFVAVLAIKAVREIGYVGASPNTQPSITVEGTGDAVASDDDIIATFSFSVMETKKTVAEAQAAATAKINAALEAIRAEGVANKDITTQSYSVYPHYEYSSAVCPTRQPAVANDTVYYCPSGKSEITGYDVSQSVEVKVRDLSKAGTLFTTVGGLGVQNVSGLTFSIDEPDTLQAEARAEAIAKAEAKAKALASQLGVRLVRVTSFYESGNYPRPMYYGKGGDVAMAQNAEALPPEIPVGEQKVTSTVNITYEIK